MNRLYVYRLSSLGNSSTTSGSIATPGDGRPELQLAVAIFFACCSSFHIHSYHLTNFFYLYVLFHSCCSHVIVMRKQSCMSSTFLAILNVHFQNSPI